VGEAQEFVARTPGEWRWSSWRAAKVKARGQLRRVTWNAAAAGKRRVQRAAHQIGEVIDDDLRVAAARLKVGEHGESRGDVGVEDRLGQRDDAIGAREAQKLFDIGGAEGLDAR
jgi:hypothetical protein